MLDFGELIPRLSRFYGPAPAEHGDWLKVRPVIFKAYAAMMPRLKAEEQLTQHALLLASEGLMMPENDRKDWAEILHLLAQGLKPREPEAATAAGLAAMGIAVERVPVAAKKAAKKKPKPRTPRPPERR